MDSSFTHDLSSSSSSTFSMRRCDELRILENSRNRSEASDLNKGLTGRDGLRWNQREHDQRNGLELLAGVHQLRGYQGSGDVNASSLLHT